MTRVVDNLAAHAPVRAPRDDRVGRTVVLACFLGSGIAALACEVSWTRMLVVRLGTGVAIAVVLAAFMGGLALGSIAGGERLARSRRPLRTYGLLELAIAACGLATIGVLPAVGAANAESLAPVIAFGVILVPTALMGATFPVLCQLLASERSGPARVGSSLWAAHAAGGVAGCLLTGFVLIPRFGVSASLVMASLVNGSSGLAALALECRWSNPSSAERDVSSVDRRESNALLGACYLLSGAVALTCQLAWNRMLSLSIGGTVYAFSLITAIFVLTLAVGAATFGRLRLEPARARTWLGGLQVALGAALVVSLFSLPWLGQALSRWLDPRTGGLTAAGLVASCAIVAGAVGPAGVLFGGVFPLVVRARGVGSHAAGSRVGRLAAVNALGAAVGAIAAVSFVIPRWGYGRTLIWGALACSLMGVVLLAGPRGRAARMRLAASLPVVVACALALTHWGSTGAGTSVYLGSDLQFREAEAEEAHLVFHADGVLGPVEVLDNPGTLSRVLRLNGKTNVNTGFVNTLFEWRKAHLPLLLADEPRAVVHVGLGTGLTTSALARHPLDRIDCVELSPEVVHAGRQALSFENRHVLEDPRVVVHVEDGRRYLARRPSGDLHDVILGDVVWADEAGAGNLHAREYFEDFRARLAPGGVACIWLQAAFFDDWHFRLVVRTFRSVFPDATLWRGSLDESRPVLALIGSVDGLAIDLDRLDERIASSPALDELRELQLGSAAELLGWLVMNSDELERFAGTGPLNTDDRPLLEFGLPHRRGPPPSFAIGGNADHVRELVIDGMQRDVVVDGVQRLREYQQVMVAAHRARKSGRSEEAVAAYTKALALRPNDRVALVLRATQRGMTPGRLLERGRDLARAGRSAEAIENFSLVLRLHPRSAEAHNNLGVVHYSREQWRDALSQFQGADRLEPASDAVQVNLARCHLQLGELAAARRVVGEVLRRDSQHEAGRRLLDELSRTVQ